MTRYFHVHVGISIFVALLTVIPAQQIYVYIGDEFTVFGRNDSLNLQVSTVNVSMQCKIDHFSEWMKNGEEYSFDDTLHFPFFSFPQGGVYSCHNDIFLSISIRLTPTGVGVFLYSINIGFYQMLSNFSEIIGPFYNDSILSCASSSLSSTRFSWYSSDNNYKLPLPMDSFPNFPFLNPISSISSANGTLLGIHLGIYFQTPNFEAIYECIAPNQDDDLVNIYIPIYSQLPVYLVILTENASITIQRNLVTGSVEFYTVPLFSALNFSCQVNDPELVLPNGKSLHGFGIDTFLFSDIGRYECRRKNFNTVSIRVDIIVPVLIFVFQSNLSSPLCTVNIGNCTLPIGSNDIYLQCNSSSSQYLWDGPIISDLSNRIYISQLTFRSSGMYACSDSLYTSQKPAQLNLHSSGIFVLFVCQNVTTAFFHDASVIISSATFTLTCLIGSVENFNIFEFSLESNTYKNLTFTRNDSLSSIQILFTEFTASDNGKYSCRNLYGMLPYLSLTLYHYKSVPLFFPQNFEVDDIGSLYISLRWNDLSLQVMERFFTGFVISYHEYNSSLITYVHGIKGLSFTLISLLPSTLYEISISTTNLLGDDLPSPSLFLTTLPSDISSIFIVLHSITSTSVHFGWEQRIFLGRNVLSFQVVISGEKQYYSVTNISENILNFPFDSTETTISNLVPDTYYKILMSSIFTDRESDSVYFYINTLEGEIFVTSPLTTLVDSAHGKEINVTLTDTSNRNADIAYHLLFAIISHDLSSNIEFKNFSSISQYQNPNIIDKYYVYILMNISSSCSFPSSFISGSFLHECLTQNGKFSNPTVLQGYTYQFILSAVTKQMVRFDSSPSIKFVVPSEISLLNFDTNAIYVIVSGFLIFLLVLLCAVLVFVAFILTRGKVSIQYYFDSSQNTSDPFVQEHPTEQRNTPSNEDSGKELPPSILDSSIFPLLLNFQIGSNVEIFVPKVCGSLPLKCFWMKDDDFVEEDAHITIGSNINLLIYDIQFHHAGVYICNVENSYGRIEIPVTLKIHGDVVSVGLLPDTEATTIPICHSSTTPPDDISIYLFGDYLETMHSRNNQGFKREYIELQEHATGTSNSVSRELSNRNKNRYSNIYPYNHSRVLIAPIPGYQEFSHDYINASFIDGFSKESYYISAQGPLNNTIGDIWRLIWQQGTKIIIMLTQLIENEKIKCSCYWPKDQCTLTLGPFIIKHVETKVNPSYFKRSFLLQNASEVAAHRTIIQYQFISWPDFGVPEISTLLDFHDVTMSMYDSFSDKTSPPLIHCSAGVGRSGTFILLDSMMQKIHHDGTINIPKFVNNMRKNRSKMIQTLEQYIFCHDALFVAFLCRKPLLNYTLVSQSNFVEYFQTLQFHSENSSKTFVQLEYQALDCISIPAQDVPCHFAKSNIHKNRNTNFLPPDYSSVSLTSTRGYVNAAFVDGYQLKHAYIIAQTPINSTIFDFWTLIADYEISNVVMLCNDDSIKDEYFSYWPDIGRVQKLQNLQITVVSVELTNHGSLQRIVLTRSSSSDCEELYLEIDHYTYIDWLQDNTPGNYDNFAVFISDLVTTTQGKDDTILVHCCDSVQKSAIFVTSCIAYERIRFNGSIDIFQTARFLRYFKPGSFQDQIQYMATYKTVKAILCKDQM